MTAENSPRTNSICECGLAFFETYLKGSLEADEQFGKRSSAYVYYIKEEKEGEISAWEREP
jgi:hypothetical protein